MGLFIRKSIEALQAEAKETGSGTLKRVLGPVSLVALGVGVIIGAGLFSITGTVAASYTGPAITLSFIIAAIGCCFAGLCYAEFASMIPVSGSAYTYSYATMGELIAWIIGWDLVLEYTVAATTVSISWSRYMTVFLQGVGIELPHAFTACPWDGGIVNIPAMIIVVLMSLILMRGTAGSSFFNGLIVFLKIAVIRYIGRVRNFRHFPWSSDCLFCLFGIRCGKHGSSGNQKSETGYAHRYFSILAGLHHLIYSLCPCHDRSSPLH